MTRKTSRARFTPATAEKRREGSPAGESRVERTLLSAAGDFNFQASFTDRINGNNNNKINNNKINNNKINNKIKGGEQECPPPTDMGNLRTNT
jgi:hypothetical protein